MGKMTQWRLNYSIAAAAAALAGHIWRLCFALCEFEQPQFYLLFARRLLQNIPQLKIISNIGITAGRDTDTGIFKPGHQWPFVLFFFSNTTERSSSLRNIPVISTNFYNNATWPSIELTSDFVASYRHLEQKTKIPQRTDSNNTARYE